MKVVLVGCVDDPWFPAYEMKAALRRNGHDCRYVPLSEGIASVASAVAARPALVVTLLGSRRHRDWKPRYVRECHDRGVVTVLWATELVHADWFQGLARAHDLVLHSVGGALDDLRRRDVGACFWLPLAYQEDLFRTGTATPAENQALRSEVAFVGTLHTAERSALIRRLLGEGFELKWWGPPSRRGISSLTYRVGRRRLRASYMGRPVYGPDFARVAAAADVFLGLDGHREVQRSWGSHLYWALGCGAAYLCRRIPGIEDVFEPGRHLEVFGDDDECVEKVRRLLNKPRARMRLSVHGRQEIMANHTYNERFRRMQEITEQVAGLRWN
jgi:spore maturation protein CgeB